MNQEVEFEYKAELNGKTHELYVIASGNCFTDPNYGADADGNRGISQDFLDDFEMTITDEEGTDITELLEVKHNAIYKAIETAAEERISQADDDYEDDYEEDEV